ncbi:MAG TPA: pilus assembly protein TadG-related protein [Candidatus Limnocylindrales bacterium]|nr:pilus assembly protein TadG-related protein [Candidatus Limnocylindrales bacterium]
MSTASNSVPHGSARGQALVIMVFGLIGMLIMSALIVDGGNAWAQQRGTQNATDSGALAGATVMLQNIAGAKKSGGGSYTSSDVLSAVQSALGSNNSTFDEAHYVGWDQSDLGSVPNDGSAIPSNAAGVSVKGKRTFGTLLAGVAGIGSLSTGANATALAGTLKGICSADSGCGLLPITFSINTTTCVGNGNIQIGSDIWPIISLDDAKADQGTGAHEAIYPTCKVGPGGVGWLDFDCGNLANQIANPCNASFDIPTWIHTSTGNPNNVEDELNAYAGKVVLIPLFDGTCRSVPNSGLVADCTDPGNGNNLYYHIPYFVALFLDRAYIQGNDHPDCNQAPGAPFVGGNGSNGCLKGWFVKYVVQGPVGQPNPNDNPGAVLGVQLVK